MEVFIFRTSPVLSTVLICAVKNDRAVAAPSTSRTRDTNDSTQMVQHSNRVAFITLK